MGIKNTFMKVAGPVAVFAVVTTGTILTTLGKTEALPIDYNISGQMGSDASFGNLADLYYNFDFTVESTTLDANSDPLIGVYTAGISSFDLTFTDLTYTSVYSGDTISSLSVWNSPSEDQFSMVVQAADVDSSSDALGLGSFTLFNPLFRDATTLELSDDTLFPALQSVAAGDFSDYTVKTIFNQSGTYVNASDSNASAQFVNNTPVPEATTAALLGIGLAGLAGVEVLRRRRNNKLIDVKAVDVTNDTPDLVA